MLFRFIFVLFGWCNLFVLSSIINHVVIYKHSFSSLMLWVWGSISGLICGVQLFFHWLRSKECNLVWWRRYVCIWWLGGVPDLQDAEEAARKAEAAQKRAADIASGAVQMNGRELFQHEPWVFDNNIYWGGERYQGVGNLRDCRSCLVDNCKTPWEIW